MTAGSMRRNFCDSWTPGSCEQTDTHSHRNTPLSCVGAYQSKSANDDYIVAGKNVEESS